MATKREKKIQAIANRIVDIDDASPYLKILVYGQNKKGKTRFATSTPNCLVLDINEEGTKSGQRGTGTKVLKVKKWEDITYAYWFLKFGDHDFEAVAIDTTTQMQNLCMRQVLGEEVDKDPNKDPELASRREWGKVAEKMKPLLLNFRNLDMHVIFVAQERVFGDEDEPEQHVPDMSNANRSTAMGAVDVIGRIYLKEVRSINKKTKKETVKVEARMMVGPRDNFITGARVQPGVEVPAIVRNPNISKLLDIVNSDEEE